VGFAVDGQLAFCGWGCDLQGLFHPARKVRQTYWKVYNNLYIGAQDSVVAFMPRFPDSEDGANTYTRHDLDLLL
jgi:splicing factor 3B subunit 1